LEIDETHRIGQASTVQKQTKHVDLKDNTCFFVLQKNWSLILSIHVIQVFTKSQCKWHNWNFKLENM